MAKSYSSQVDAIIIKMNEQVSGETSRKILTKIAIKVHDDVGEYPGTSSANFAPGNNGYSWYERSIGTKTRTGRTYATSQKFNKGWPDKPTFQGDFKAKFENKTTYGGYLMGDAQVRWAKGVGWQKVSKVLEENSKSYAEIARKEIAKVNKS